jgi:hypothetical protein
MCARHRSFCPICGQQLDLFNSTFGLCSKCYDKLSDQGKNNLNRSRCGICGIQILILVLTNVLIGNLSSNSNAKTGVNYSNGYNVLALIMIIILLSVEAFLWFISPRLSRQIYNKYISFKKSNKSSVEKDIKTPKLIAKGDDYWNKGDLDAAMSTYKEALTLAQHNHEGILIYKIESKIHALKQIN